MTKENDETPPVETESKETEVPETPPAPESTTEEVKEAAQEHHEEVPAWGKKLTESVDALG
ncbi:MAG TPA: hypothetical protein VIY48_16160, partial [Candidatus Paceibacterota bacterium]